MPLYDIAKGAPAQSSDIEQIIGGLKGTVDLGQLRFLQPLSPPSTAPTASVNTTSGNLTGNYGYVYTIITGVQQSNGTVSVTGETTPSPVSNTISPSGQQANVSWTAPSTITGAIGVRLYRNKASGSATTGPFYLVTEIDNTTQASFTDNVADASLGAQAPTQNTTGTTLQGVGGSILTSPQFRMMGG